MTQAELIRAATLFRSGLPAAAAPRGMCLQWSYALACALEQAGADVTFCEGFFACDIPVAWAGGAQRVHHCWLQAGDWLIDVTADQFNAHVAESLGAVEVRGAGQTRRWSGAVRLELRAVELLHTVAA